MNHTDNKDPADEQLNTESKDSKNTNLINTNSQNAKALLEKIVKDNDDDIDIELTDEDLARLHEQGINVNELEKIAEEVNEQLSDNANKKRSDTKNQSLIEPTPNQRKLDDKISRNKQAIIDLKQTQQEEQERQFEAFKQYLAEKQTQERINYKDVRINIEANAIPSKMFYIMNGLAAITAGYGMLLNSPAVVIGAMLIAMMLGPITGIALGLIDYRLTLIKKSLYTLITGTMLIYAIGLILGFMHPEYAMTNEILARTRPNTMDIAVALAGGIAGAYGMISPHLSVAVVGVALATTLVPPIVASGILLANGEFMLALNAMILTTTNILAIQLTNALVLWWAGFRRLDTHHKDAQATKKTSQAWLFTKRNAVTLVLLTIVSVYLTINFQQGIRKQRFEKQVRSIIKDSIKSKPLYLVNATFDATKDDKQYLIRAIIQGTIPITHAQVADMEHQLHALNSDITNKPIKLQIRFVPEQVIESTPVSKDDVKLGNAEIHNIQSK